MKVAKQAVSYYTLVTSKGYDEFYSSLDRALANPAPTGEDWLIQHLVTEIKNSGISVTELKANKDVIRGTADESSRRKEGEFYTPILWADEGRKYFDKHVPNWKEYNMWDGSCGMGNLLKNANHEPSKTFLSTLRPEDAEVVKQNFPDATVFPLDFLNKIDYDVVNMEFYNGLPERLQEILRNDEPLIFYMNPPYKSGMAKTTDVGVHMTNIGMGRSAGDLFYQFLWRVNNLVEHFQLKNTWFCTFGPLTLFTGYSPAPILEEMEHCFEFIDGMCLSATEFNDTSESVKWGIGCTLWKSRGGYQRERLHKDILLEKKFKDLNGDIVTDGRVLFSPPRLKLSEWVKPKDVVRYKQAPLMTSQVTFKDSETKEVKLVGRLAENALGTLMSSNILAGRNKAALMSMPSSMQYIDLTKENFWRGVAFFVSRVVLDGDYDWAASHKDLSAPLTSVEGYEEWLYNCIPMFLFAWKSFPSSLRNVDWNGEMCTIRNKLFYCTEEEIRQNCTDEVILEDLNNNPPLNQFMLDIIKESEPHWVDETRELYDFCKGYTLFSLDKRKEFEYKTETNCWDAGFHQIRACCWGEDLEETLRKKVSVARQYLLKDIRKFGFIVGE